jgi:hypothetical protein
MIKPLEIFGGAIRVIPAAPAQARGGLIILELHGWLFQ